MREGLNEGGVKVEELKGEVERYPSPGKKLSNWDEMGRLG